MMMMRDDLAMSKKNFLFEIDFRICIGLVCYFVTNSLCTFLQVSSFTSFYIAVCCMSFCIQFRAVRVPNIQISLAFISKEIALSIL